MAKNRTLLNSANGIKRREFIKIAATAAAAVAVPVLAPELPPTLGGVLAALDGAYPGIRFRMIDEQGQVRPHIKLFVDTALTRDMATPLAAGAAVMIVAALSGG